MRKVLLEFFTSGLPAKHLIEILPAQEKGLFVGNAVKALRHPQIDIEGARFVLNGPKRLEVVRDRVLFQALVKGIGEHNLRRPETVLLGIFGEPYLETLDRFGLDVSLGAGLRVVDDD